MTRFTFEVADLVITVNADEFDSASHEMVNCIAKNAPKHLSNDEVLKIQREVYDDLIERGRSHENAEYESWETAVHGAYSGHGQYSENWIYAYKVKIVSEVAE